MSSLPHMDNVRIVLVNTSHPGNIGATARAMKNMGLRHLTLVDPMDFPSDVATWRAVSGADILERATVVPDLASAVADCGLVVAASARSRRMPWPMMSPRDCGQQMAREAAQNQVALVLGREDKGLKNEELQLAHYHVQIPADEEYSSLNLAAAATVLMYEVRMAFLALAQETSREENDYWDVPRATGEQMEHFYRHLEKVLIDLDFHDPENPRLLMPRLRRLFGRIRVDQMENNILRGILTHVEQATGKKQDTP